MTKNLTGVKLIPNNNEVANVKNRIETVEKKLLVGKHAEMSFIMDGTFELWKSFMPNRKHIENKVDSLFYSMQIYPEIFDCHSFNPSSIFTKWAAVEVTDLDFISPGLEGYVIEGGTYAVFNHIGPARNFPVSMKYIHEIWFPNSDYEIDNREHFEVLEEGYNPLDENATEEIWIPIKLKKKDE